MRLEELAGVLRRLRGQGRRIVQCHGVFDLLHIGHIRHFEAARRHGDVLVVTVTPDRYVNKGPHRPVFNEGLRTEAVGALDCVNFAAVNRWPTAVETIRLLRPHVYVKGPDYRSAEQDPTGGIRTEEAAIRGIGGRFVVTDEITFSSSHLINRRLPVFSKELSDYLLRLSRRHDVGDLVRLIQGAKGLKTLVVGEAILDEYVYCDAIGKSSKGPTLVVKRLQGELFAGGILAVGNHVANFCDRVGLVSFLGASPSRLGFIRRELRPNIRPRFLFRKGAPTIVKRRYVEHYHFTKLLEVYEIDDSLLDAGNRRGLCAMLKEELPKYDVVVIVDYGHGMFSDEAVRLLLRRASFLTVNAQCNAGNLGYHTIGRYAGADFACVAENEVRIECRDQRGDLRSLVLDMAKRLGFRHLIVTRGNQGCLCYDAKEGFIPIPAMAGEVKDRVGAGDAFLSLAALCMAQGAPVELAGFLGNAAGAQAVATIGNRAPVEKAALLKHVESLLK